VESRKENNAKQRHNETNNENQQTMRTKKSMNVDEPVMHNSIRDEAHDKHKKQNMIHKIMETHKRKYTLAQESFPQRWRVFRRSSLWTKDRNTQVGLSRWPQDTAAGQAFGQSTPSRLLHGEQNVPVGVCNAERQVHVEAPRLMFWHTTKIPGANEMSNALGRQYYLQEAELLWIEVLVAVQKAKIVCKSRSSWQYRVRLETYTNKSRMQKT
jgi:hypothetical protein